MAFLIILAPFIWFFVAGVVYPIFKRMNFTEDCASFTASIWPLWLILLPFIWVSDVGSHLTEKILKWYDDTGR